jgi:Holliday junction resolvasome RuvABC endonuclease subunit
MYIGVDTSTRSVCLAVLEKCVGGINSEWYWYKLNGDNLFDKMDEAYKYTFGWIEAYTGMPEYIIVGIEEPVYIQNGKTHRALCCIYGSVVKAFMDSKIIPQPVNISTWKKIVVGKGNSNKQQVKERVMNLLSFPDNLEQDVYDALGIACYVWKGGGK